MRRPGLLLAVALVVLGGCGSSGKDGEVGSGGVRWTKSPLVYQPPRLPRDRVVMGQVRNTTNSTLTLDARRVVVRDAAGHALESSGRFAASYGHALYGAFQRPSFDEPSELARLGVVVYMNPGTRSPLWVAFRALPTSQPPFTASFGAGGRLPLPDR